MSRHRPLHGADSVEALDPEIRALIVNGSWELDTLCLACSLPAVTDGLCAGHARLGEYRVTDEKHWASNE